MPSTQSLSHHDIRANLRVNRGRNWVANQESLWPLASCERIAPTAILSGVYRGRGGSDRWLAGPVISGPAARISQYTPGLIDLGHPVVGAEQAGQPGKADGIAGRLHPRGEGASVWSGYSHRIKQAVRHDDRLIIRRSAF